MLVAKRPHHQEADCIEVVLTPLYMGLEVAGFRLKVSGEMEQVYLTPAELAQDDLGNQMTVCLIGCDFAFPRHNLQSRRKSARK